MAGDPVPDDADDVIRVAPGVRIPRKELRVSFAPSGGPGGQHANKAATRVELTFDIAGSPSLIPVHRARAMERLGPTLRVVVDDERSQVRNRAIAEERFAARLAAALRVDAPRRPTKPSKGAKERRLQEKKRRSQTKADRRRPLGDA